MAASRRTRFKGAHYRRPRHDALLRRAPSGTHVLGHAIAAPGCSRGRSRSIRSKSALHQLTPAITIIEHAEGPAYLDGWETHWADARIHGTRWPQSTPRVLSVVLLELTSRAKTDYPFELVDNLFSSP